MNAVINTSSEYKPSNLRKKSSFRRNGSYRIFHITKKQREDSDEDGDPDTKNGLKENDVKIKGQKKSFKRSSRNGLDGSKRKSTKNKRLLFLHKTSGESTLNEIKSPTTSNQLRNDLSQSIISNKSQSKHLLNKSKQDIIDESSESDALVDAFDKTVNHDEAALNDLLARADKLETTVKTQDFNKVQPITRTNLRRKRKHFIIACGTTLIILTIIIAIIIFVLIMTLRYKAHMDQLPKSSSIPGQHR